MMQRRVSFIVFAAVIAGLFVAPAVAAAENSFADETKEQKDARMQWWREARFGMFIHWGVYSVPAGTYEGKEIPGIGEWIMHRGRIPVARYREYAKQFNPVKYDPDAWVRLAKEAGMKYIVITSKHHDGFALFDSKASDWNVVKATPYGKDLLKPLAEACRKYGVRLGFYYSEAQDWNNPGGAASGGHWDPAQDGSMDDYIRKVAAPQVQEILSNYGPLAILWWDTPVDMTKERADLLFPLTRRQPGIITNNRLGGGYEGDTDTPEQYIPGTGLPGRDWEVCMTMNNTWGYKSYDNNWKSTASLIRNLVDIASKGGNYLLNVGPTSEGLIPEPSIQRLKEIGAWTKVNGEAVYATQASPFKSLPWGRCTRKTTPHGTMLYLHVFDWPKDGKLLLPGLRNETAQSWVLADSEKKPLRTRPVADGVVLTLPANAPDTVSSTVVVDVTGVLQVDPVLLAQDAHGIITLRACDATLHGEKLRYESGHKRDNIGCWTDPAEWAEWRFVVTRPGKFDVTAKAAGQGAGTFRLEHGKRALEAGVPNTGDYAKFKDLNLGTLKIRKSGQATIAVKPAAKDWQALNLQSITFTPMK
jgi:alpha-L-fucosidase